MKVDNIQSSKTSMKSELPGNFFEGDEATWIDSNVNYEKGLVEFVLF